MNIKTINITYAKLCDKGGRAENQDRVQVHPKTPDQPQHFIVADGLGGQGGGKLASQVAVRTYIKHIADSEIGERFEKAHTKIRKIQESDETGSYYRMASTLVALEIQKNQATWAHAGDSRLYLIRKGAIFKQTKDHSVPQMLVASGEITEEEVRRHPDRNRILRAVGDRREILEAKVQTTETLETGDVFLLCSDGFWDWVTEEDMLKYLKRADTVKIWLDQLREILLEHATGRYDNYTALAVWYEPPPSLAPETEKSLIQRIKAWLGF